MNTDGRPGYGKPIDQIVEHYNLLVWVTTFTHTLNMYIQCTYVYVPTYTCYTHVYIIFRNVKEGVQVAGANTTQKHIEEISLCGMFLLKASKRAGKVFNVPHPATHHTVRDATGDILLTMTNDLLAKRAVEKTRALWISIH